MEPSSYVVSSWIRFAWLVEAVDYLFAYIGHMEF